MEKMRKGISADSKVDRVRNDMKNKKCREAQSTEKVQRLERDESFLLVSCIVSRVRKGWRIYGGIAQLGERLPCKQEVSGSNPLISTTIWADSSVG